ncbi:MAG: hypothetical protein ACRDMY_11785 [Gaiellaceae bacterium]
MPRELAVMPIAGIDIDLPTWSVLIPLFGALWTLWVNGDRAERQRRRELHARALEAVLSYREMPFMIRRRRHEKEERSAERVRLSTHLSKVQTELSACEHLMAANGPNWLANEYEKLVTTVRRIAGKEAHEAWKADPVSNDAEVNMPELFARLKPVNDAVDEFRRQISWADKTRRERRFRRGGPPRERG